MKPLTNLEATLRGFVPRRPSPKLRNRLFPVTPAPRPATNPRRIGSLGLWAAPLTATAMLVLSVATAWPPHSTVAGSLSLATLPSGWAAHLTPQIEQNAPPRPSFRSTTPGGMTSSFGSLLLRQTNVFAR